MAKKEYLKELKKKLRFKMKQEEVASIIRDYDEFFEIGLEKGKSEQVIRTELGNPNDVANRLLEEMDNKNDFFLLSIRKSMIRNGFIMLLLFICGMGFIKVSKWGYPIYVAVIGYFVVALLLLAIINRVAFKHPIPIASLILKKNEKKELLLLHSVFLFITFILMVGFFIISGNAFLEYVDRLAKLNKNIYYIGPIIGNTLYILVGIIGIILILTVFKIRKNGTFIYYSLIFHGLGIIVMILEYKGILHSLSTVEFFRQFVLQVNIIYIETLIVCICLLFLYRRRIKDGRTV